MYNFVVYQLNRGFDAKTQCVMFVEIDSSCINFLVVIQLSNFVEYIIQHCKLLNVSRYVSFLITLSHKYSVFFSCVQKQESTISLNKLIHLCVCMYMYFYKIYKPTI